MSYDKRQALPAGCTFEIIEETNSNHYSVTISKEIGRGGSCIVYQGVLNHSLGEVRADKKVIIKEYFPKRLEDSIIRNEENELLIADPVIKNSFEDELQRSFLPGQAKHIVYANENPDNALPSVSYSGRALGTFYAISDFGQGQTLSELDVSKLSIVDALRISASICDAICAVHKGKAYQLYLDCKPANIFVNGLHAYLFDFNTVQYKDKIRCCSYSEGWSAPEQEFNSEGTGYADIKLIGYHTDIYSISAVLFWLLTGICPSKEDVKRLTEEYDWQKHLIPGDPTRAIEDSQFINELDRIIKKSLELDPNKRKEDYSESDSALKLKRDLEHLISLAENVTYKSGFEDTNSHIESAKKEILDAIKKKEEFDHTLNFDTEIERKFEELFGSKDKTNKSTEQTFVDILNKLYINNYVKELNQNNPKGKEENSSTYSENDFDEYGEWIRPVQFNNGHATLEGQHFSMIDNKERVIVVYRTKRNYDIKDFTYYYTAERLDYIDKKVGDKNKRTFFIESPDKETQLSVITFDNKNKLVIVNSGILYPIKGVLKLSTSPSVIKVDIPNGTSKTKEFSCDEKSSIILLDPTTGKEMPRIKKTDDKGNEKYYIEMHPHKSYFAFQIRNHDSNSNKYPMDEEDVGDFFMKGIKGFSNDIYNALIWYEKAKTPTAYKKMVDIFSNDPFFADEELAEKYRLLSEGIE